MQKFLFYSGHMYISLHGFFLAILSHIQTATEKTSEKETIALAKRATLHLQKKQDIHLQKAVEN